MLRQVHLDEEVPALLPCTVLHSTLCSCQREPHGLEQVAGAQLHTCTGKDVVKRSSCIFAYRQA